MRVRIEVRGCDASTYVIKEVSDNNLAFLKELAKEVTDASEYGCMPVMGIEENFKETKE